MPEALVGPFQANSLFVLADLQFDKGIVLMAFALVVDNKFPCFFLVTMATKPSRRLRKEPI